MKKTSKRAAALLCAVLLLVTAAGCGGGRVSGKGGGAGGSGCFTVAVGTLPDGFNPFTADSDLSREFFLLCYDPLWRYGTDYEPENCLVDSFDVSSDGLTWTVRLRQDVTFCDEARTPLTSADVKFSYELFMQYGLTAKRDFDFIRSIVCPDDYTVVFSTDEVKGDMMYTEIPILPKALWESCETEPETMDNSAMIGTGPFIYQPVELSPGETQTEWHFLARGDYFAGGAYIDELCFRYYELTTNASNALVDGLADACMDLTDVQLFSLEEEKDIRTFEVVDGASGCCELMMNMQSGALTDSVVREAILRTLDKDTVYSMGFGNVGQRSDFFLPVVSPFYLNEPLPFTLDPVQSATLLAGSLYQDYDGDDILESRDNTMELRFTLLSGQNDSWATATATVLARDLGRLGFKIDWKTISDEELASTCRKDGEWDMCLVCHEGGIDPQDTAARYAGGKSVTGWQSEEYDALFDQLVHCIDPQQKADVCRSMQRIVGESFPGAILGFRPVVQAIRTDKWKGYDEAEASLGGLFGVGSYKTYMSVRLQSVEDEEIAEETETQDDSIPGDFDVSTAPATAVPLEPEEYPQQPG